MKKLLQIQSDSLDHYVNLEKLKFKLLANENSIKRISDQINGSKEQRHSQEAQISSIRKELY